MRLCFMRTKDFKDTLHFVMCDHWTGLIRLDSRGVKTIDGAGDTRGGGHWLDPSVGAVRMLGPPGSTC